MGVSQTDADRITDLLNSFLSAACELVVAREWHTSPGDRVMRAFR